MEKLFSFGRVWDGFKVGLNSAAYLNFKTFLKILTCDESLRA